MKYKQVDGVCYYSRYRVVWCTKYRRNVLDEDIQIRTKELIADICKELSIELYNLVIEPDRVNMLIDVNPRLGIHLAVKRIKGKTSRILRSEFKSLSTRLPTLWTNSYFFATLGDESSDMIDQYIELQKNV